MHGDLTELEEPQGKDTSFPTSGKCSNMIEAPSPKKPQEDPHVLSCVN